MFLRWVKAAGPPYELAWAGRESEYLGNKSETHKALSKLDLSRLKVER